MEEKELMEEQKKGSNTLEEILNFGISLVIPCNSTCDQLLACSRRSGLSQLRRLLAPAGERGRGRPPARQAAGGEAWPGPDRVLPASSPATVNLDGVVQLR